MNKEEFYFYHENFTKKILDISKRKGADYCGETNSDPFANFRQVEILGICTTEQGFLARMTDKMSRVASLIKQDAHVKDESIEDTLGDLANYAILMSAFLKSKQRRVIALLPKEDV